MGDRTGNEDDVQSDSKAHSLSLIEDDNGNFESASGEVVLISGWFGIGRLTSE